MHILHIDASGRHEGSQSRYLSAYLTERLQKKHDATVTYRDVSEGMPFVGDKTIAAYFTPDDARTPEQKELLTFSDMLVDELFAADVLVIGTPMYNFCVPASLKAWIDLVVRVGRTFRYIPTGVEGLLKNKKVYVTIATGDTAIGSELDCLSGYLRIILGFVGLTDVTFVAAAELMKNNAAAKVKRAEEEIDRLVA